MNIVLRRLCVCTAFAVGLTAASAAVRLPAIFSSNMVLQRDLKVPVWGWADAGERITVVIGGERHSTRADAQGRWRVKIGPFPAGGPYTLTVTGATNSVALANVLAGDVWICSGQSNMEWNVGGTRNAAEEIAAATFPQIRLFTVPKSIQFTPLADCQPGGAWVECSPKTVAGFSAVGYFFGRHLFQATGVPVGLINSSWGGTVAEAWTSRETLCPMPDFKPGLDTIAKATSMDLAAAQREFETKQTAWQKAFDEQLAVGGQKDWSAPGVDDKGWKQAPLPGFWEEHGLPNFDGIVWYRKTVDIPAALAGKELTLSLGPIDDDDVTYVNGTRVGATEGWTVPRIYQVPANLVKAGPLVLAVRVLDKGGGGGFHGTPEVMTLGTAGQPAVALAGPWAYDVVMDMAKIPPRPAAPPLLNNPNQPTVLYNGMLAPLVPFGLRGAIWYQGESNAGRAYQYRTLFPAMISDWRRHWGQGKFPFFFVQLANFMAAKDQPGDSAWAELREAQSMTLALPHTGQAVIIDVGEAADIHPRNKQDVGKRLALAAEATVFGLPVEYSGPVYAGMRVQENVAIVRFTHVGTALRATDNGVRVKQFAIAGADRKFVWADARIMGPDTIAVSSPQVPKPVAVRYAWADNPEGCDLRSSAGLPASPFRTDRWPGVTGSGK